MHVIRAIRSSVAFEDEGVVGLRIGDSEANFSGEEIGEE